MNEQQRRYIEKVAEKED